MLVLTRKVGDVIAIGDNIKIVVMAIKGKQVRLGVQADRNTVVHREEIYQKIQQEIKAAMQSDMGTTKVAGEMLKNAQSSESSTGGQPQSSGGTPKKAEPSKLSSGGAGGGTGVFRRVEIRRAAQPPAEDEDDFDSDDSKPTKR
ncbi:MAG: carbon storage regulator CsrA [Betaproteobacteria bacterium]|nr:carbon storage regulator CsrA [Betaproteobacteria bacterium]